MTLILATLSHSRVTSRRGVQISADAPGGTFWLGGIFGHQCSGNRLTYILSHFRVVDRQT